MKLGKLIKIFIALFVTSCTDLRKPSEGDKTIENQKKVDTVISYCKPNYESFLFDTILNQTSFHMKTFCLNDSAVYQEIFTDNRKENKNLVELAVGHNYRTDFTIKPLNSNTIKLNITKETFRTILPSDFYKVCVMWKNEFLHIKNKQLLFQATLAKTGTDYQFAVQYSINEKGSIKIVKVEDESYVGDENE
jgi:hypothetical protein